MDEEDVLAPLVKFAMTHGVINNVIKITAENVNQRLFWRDRNEVNWLLLAVSWYGCTEEIVKKILSLKPIVVYKSLRYCRYEFYELLLEYGIDVHMHDEDGNRFFDTFSKMYPPLRACFLFVDYGAKLSNGNEIMSKTFSEYVSISNKRVSLCRKALLALLCACNVSLFPMGRAFGALNGIISQMTSQVWRMRGGEGCGPRAHLWNLKEENDLKKKKI